MNSGNQTAELQSLSATSIFWKLCTTPGLLLQQNCCLVQKMIWKVRNTVSEKQQHVISISAAFSASLKSFSPIPSFLPSFFDTPRPSKSHRHHPPARLGDQRNTAKPSTRDICCQAAFLPPSWEGPIYHSHIFPCPSQKNHQKAAPAEKVVPRDYYSKDTHLLSGATDRFSRSSSSAIKEKILSSHLRNKASVTQHYFKSTFCVTTVSVSNILIFTTPLLDVGNNLSLSCKTGTRSLISSAYLWHDEEYSLIPLHPIITISLPSRAEMVRRD